MKEDKKRCPIMTLAQHGDDGECVENECAWYIASAAVCAFIDLTVSIDVIRYELAGI